MTKANILVAVLAVAAVLGAGALAVLVINLGDAPTAGASTTFDVRGDYTSDFATSSTGGTCVDNTNGVVSGMQAIVYAGSGDVLGSSLVRATRDGDSCYMAWDVAGLPKGQGGYMLRLGDHRFSFTPGDAVHLVGGGSGVTRS